MTVEIESVGKKETRRIPYPADAGGPDAWERSLAASPLAPGQTRSFRSFEPTALQVVEEILTAFESEPVELLDRRERLLRIARTVRRADGHEYRFTLWCDAAGTCWKTRDDALGLESFRTTRDRALAESGGGSVNLLFGTTIRLAEPLPRGGRTRRAVYRCRVEHGDPLGLFAEDAFQSVRRIDARSVELDVRSIDARGGGRGPKGAAKPPTADDLAPSSLVQSDDPRVAALAAEGAGDATRPSNVARRLEAHLRRSMRSVNLSNAFASAAEVARNLEGDCSEHAVLLAALARARGLPARVALGLVYLPESPQKPAAFGYHMWTEVWIAKADPPFWLPLDATAADGVRRPLYMKIADTSFKDGLGDSALLAVARALGSGLTIVIAQSE